MAFCSVKRNKQTNEIEKVLAPNGEESILFKNILGDQSVTKEEALRTWAKVYTKSFRDQFGDWTILEDIVRNPGNLPENPFYFEYFLKDPERFLHEVAQQTSLSSFEQSGTVNTFGQEVVNAAMALFPAVQNGDPYVSRFEGKLDKNYEPLINYIDPADIKPKQAIQPIAFNRKSENYKEVLSPENQKKFERLIGLGLITAKRWNGMYFVPKSKYQQNFGRPFNDYRNGYYVNNNSALRQLQAIVEREGLDWLKVEKLDNSHVVKIVPSAQEYSQQKLFGEVGKEAFTNIADRLSKRLGVKYEIINREQALEITKNSSIPWNGEGAFAYKDKVYVLQEALSVENAIHEFAHFFVRAVHVQSPYLINKLYDQLKADPTGKKYVDAVEEIYKDFSGAERKEEILVRAITDRALNLVDEKTGNVILEAIKKIWETLKTIIRNVFGKRVLNLDENTTLDQLAGILIGETEGEVLDLGEQSFFNELFPMYNREIANQLEKLSSSAVKSSINSFFNVVSEHVKRLNEDRDLKSLREILKNDRNSTLLKDNKELLKLAKDFAVTIDEKTAVDRAALTTFSESIEGIEIISKRMRDHVRDTVSDKNISSQDKLALFRKYSFIAREWRYVIDKFKEAINDSPLEGSRNILGDTIRNIEDNFEFIDKKIIDFYQKDGLIDMFRTEITENIFFQAAVADQKARVEQLKTEAEKGNILAQQKLKKEQEVLRKYEFTDEIIGRYLAGEMGDTNYYSMYLESYTSNPDPIVGTFTNWFLKHKKRAEVKAQQRLTVFSNIVSKLYKKLGFTPSDFQKVAGELIYKERIFKRFNPETKEPEYQDVWKFKNQYGNDKDGKGWEDELRKLEARKEDAKALIESAAGGYENYRKAALELEEFKMNYMFDRESDKVKEARKFWYRDAITSKAKQLRDDILNRIRKNSYETASKDEQLEKVDENKALWREFSRLGSLRYADGKLKPEGSEDQLIALAIQEHRQKYGDLYEDVEIKGMFEANLLSFKNELIDKLVGEGKGKTEEEIVKLPEYKKALNEWYRDNIRINLTKDFYDERNEIIARIKALTNKINDSRQRQQLDIASRWEQIIDMVKGYRDEDNQPIGSDLSDAQIKDIMKLEKEIAEIQENLSRLSGLSEEEADQLEEWELQLQRGIRLSQQDFARYKELVDKSKIQLSRQDRNALNKAFEELKSLQSKIVTTYYRDTVNEFLSKAGSNIRVNQFNVEEKLTPGVIDRILKDNPDFSKWWNANHMLREYWDYKNDAMVTSYQPLYVWRRTIPVDNLFQTFLENQDFENLLTYKSKYIKIEKSRDYYYKRLKPEYENRQGRDTLWVTHDNNGNWLPKPTERSATKEQKDYMLKHNIPFADDRFENKNYLEMKEDQSERGKALFELLEEYKKFHLETQEELPGYARLGLEVPRMAKNNVERANLNTLAEKPEKFFKNIKNWLGMTFTKRRDDFELGTGSYDPKAHAKAYALTDLMGNQINSVPIKYMSSMDPDEVSMDIGKSVSMYAVSAETNKVLHEINPVANALKEVLSKNSPKDPGLKSRSLINIVSNAITPNTSQNANKKGSYNRLQIINNFLNRELEGMSNIQQFGPVPEKIFAWLMRIGAWGSLGLNVFAGIKNAIAGRIQNNLEAVYGVNLTPETLLKSNVEFTKLMGSLFSDYYKLGNKSLNTQLFLLFDPMNNFQSKAGTDFSKTGLRDALDLRFIMGPQKFGEINIQGSAWLAMMLHQKVKYSEPGQKEREIPYLEAWELRDGVAQLKEGVDKSWALGGRNFLQFVSRIHKVNELNQGAYSEESQPEIARYTLGKLFLFMRKFYIPGAVNRLAKKRFNAGLGSFREGYWIPLLDAIRTTAGSIRQGHIPTAAEYKAAYSKVELRSMLRSLSELGFVGMMALLIQLLGFDDDDEDKYDKLSQNSFMHNFLLYQLMLIKSETETFIPAYGMGVNETVRLLGTPSIAFNTARRWIKVGDDFLSWILGQDEATYQRDSGIYKEGDIKFFADLLTIIGWKNFSYLTDNQDIQEGIKLYASLQRRI